MTNDSPPASFAAYSAETSRRSVIDPKALTELETRTRFRIRIFFADPDPGKNLHADPDPDPGGIRGRRLGV